MWICLNNAFISAVEASPGSDLLKVRARKKKHLKALFPKNRIHQDKLADYRYRVFTRKATLAKILAKRVLELDYGNFKDSVKEPALKSLYSNFWFDHKAYQDKQDKRLVEPLRLGYYDYGRRITDLLDVDEALDEDRD